MIDNLKEPELSQVNMINSLQKHMLELTMVLTGANNTKEQEHITVIMLQHM